MKFANLRRTISWSTAAVGLALGGIVVWKSILPLPEHRLSVIVLDVPGGPAYLVKTPGGGVVLIGGSSDAVELNRSLVDHLAGRVRKIDVWLAVGRAKETINGVMGLLDQYEIEMVLLTEPIAADRSWQDVRTALEKQGAQLILIQNGQQVDLREGARLGVLANPERGTALQISWQRFYCLIPGGTDPAGYNTLWKPPQSPLLILGYSDLDGSRKLLWKDVQPNIVLVSGKCPAEWGWSAPGCVDSAVHGWLKANTDGNQLWLESER